ncbi:hypothetical protein AB1Y20_006222 [Prymnesium parvum]|uniref:PIPK domain-containing protein n=1 Tax=Prymnesium parvum TaxID=97485 RepID=A0AB34J188_PRYPA
MSLAPTTPPPLAHHVGPAQLLHLPELPTRGPFAASVRVLATLTQLDVHAATALASHRGASCALDLRALCGESLRAGELYHFVGELEVGRGGARTLRVRLARPMAGVDVELYERALEARRGFVERLALSGRVDFRQTKQTTNRRLRVASDQLLDIVAEGELTLSNIRGFRVTGDRRVSATGDGHFRRVAVVRGLADNILAANQCSTVYHYLASTVHQPPVSAHEFLHPNRGPVDMSWAHTLFCDVTVALPERDVHGKVCHRATDGCHLGYDARRRGHIIYCPKERRLGTFTVTNWCGEDSFTICKLISSDTPVEYHQIDDLPMAPPTSALLPSHFRSGRAPGGVGVGSAREVAARRSSLAAQRRHDQGTLADLAGENECLLCRARPHAPEEHKCEELGLEAEFTQATASANSPALPDTVEKAKSSPFWPMVKDALESEIKGKFVDNQAWEVVQRTPDMHVIRSKAFITYFALSSRTMEDARSRWHAVRRAHSTLTKLCRRRVHKDNYFGHELRGTDTEEEKIAAAIELGVGWLSRADEATAEGRIGFTDAYDVPCHIERKDVRSFRRVRRAFGVSELEYTAVLARGVRPHVASADAPTADGAAPLAPFRANTENRRPSLLRDGHRQGSGMRVLALSATSGKSLSWFLMTQGMEYVLKSADDDEVRAVVALLPAYSEYVEQHAAHTLLPRYFDLLVLERAGVRVSLLVMSNVFAGHHPITCRFDVKGATYGRAASAHEIAKGASATHKDLDLLARGAPLVVAHPQLCARLVEAVERDAFWLAGRGLLDYSLLIGLAHQPCTATSPISRHVQAVPLVGEEGEQGEGANLAYVGIVDILMPYTAVKCVEAAVLGLLLGDISCKSPGVYASRFSAFIRHIFVAAPFPRPTRDVEFARQWIERPGAAPIWPLSLLRRAGTSQAGAEFGRKDVLLVVRAPRFLVGVLVLLAAATIAITSRAKKR